MHVFLLSLVLVSTMAFVSSASYAAKSKVFDLNSLCSSEKHECIKVRKGDTWERLFPDPERRDIVMRLNRTNMKLYLGQTVAIPKNLANLSIWDIAPFSRKITNYYGKKLIVVNQKKLAWGAYDENGDLQWWGPISSGKDYCKDVNRSCKTITGMFYVFNTDGEKCESSVFPVGEGGAKMPFCMFFYRGYALHGSEEVPGRRDSHGCVRLFTNDAMWLNQHFVTLPSEENSFTPMTAVIIQDL